MELRQLEYFVAIAETRSFSRAATRCLVAQPALSQQVRRLEAELGAQLFVRTTRSVALTDAGETLLRNARRVLADVAHARAEVDAITGLVRGRLTIGAIQFVPCIDIPRVLAAFHARYPGVDVVLRTADNERMLAAVRSGQLDVAFVSFRAARATRATRATRAVSGAHTVRTGRADRADDPDADSVSPSPAADLGRLEVLTEPLLAVIARDHPLADRSCVALADLAAEPFIELGPGSGLRGQSDHAFSAAGLERHVALEVAGLDDMLELAALGLGVALLPRSLLRARRGVAVRALPLDGEPAWRSVALVWREPEPVSPSARAFVADVRRALDR
jgi:DNA-binding transcriptional LysR family regulator